MASLTIKNIPDTLYEQLKAAAESHRRSINSEVLVYLEKALTPAKMTPAERLAHIERRRATIDARGISPVDIAEAIDNGRP